MKLIAMTLLGLTLCAPVWASIEMSTMHGVNEGCELRSKATQGKEHISAVDWFNIGRVEGYITGYAEATPGVHFPETVGELHDAACRYINLHPEIWNLPSYKGLGLVLHTLYGEKP